MLTPIEIQSKVFKSGIGYDKKDVEAFMKNVLSNYEELYKENVELRDKISTLSDGIQYYKSIEKTLQKALVLAERTAEETKQAADKQAKMIEKEALSKAKLIVADAKNELDSLHAKTIDLLRQYDMYKAQFKQLAQTQVELLNSDSFNINVANLDAFATDHLKNQLEKEYSYYEEKENQCDSDDETNMESSNQNESLSYQPVDNGYSDLLHKEKDEESKDEEDAFEFLNNED